jgi:hypothetical protein
MALSKMHFRGLLESPPERAREYFQLGRDFDVLLCHQFADGGAADAKEVLNSLDNLFQKRAFLISL